MNKLYFLIIISILFSCERTKKHENKETKKIYDTCYLLKKKYQDSISEEWKKESIEDSIEAQIIDSLKRYVRFIKNNKDISVKQRIKRLRKLYWSTFPVSNLWNCYYEDININIDEFFANELEHLFQDTTIVNYDIDSIFSSIDVDYDMCCHSKDNRLWVISWLNSGGGTGNCPINLIICRDINGKFLNSKYTDECFVYYNKIYKLNNTEKDLYLLIGSSKGVYYGVKIIELTTKGVNFDYKGFKTKNGFCTQYELPVANYRDDFDENNIFDSVNQVFKFSGNATGWYDCREDSVTIGTFTFNGKYFTEKSKMQKMKSPNP